MTIKSLALATLVLGTSFGTAFAEGDGLNVPVDQSRPAASSVVIEGRQAAPIATVTSAEQYVIDHNAVRN